MSEIDAPFPVVDCPKCGRGTIFDDEEPFAEGDRFWCASCGTDLGGWGETFARFYGPEWPALKASLGRRA